MKKVGVLNCGEFSGFVLLWCPFWYFTGKLKLISLFGNSSKKSTHAQTLSEEKTCYCCNILLYLPSSAVKTNKISVQRKMVSCLLHRLRRGWSCNSPSFGIIEFVSCYFFIFMIWRVLEWFFPFQYTYGMCKFNNHKILKSGITYTVCYTLI